MKTDWKKEQLKKIQNGTSVFKLIPQEIGEVLYCDTTYPVHDGTDSNTKPKVFLIIAAIIVVVLWLFLYKTLIYLPIIATIIVACIASYILSRDNGTDYLLGKNGFAVLKYKKVRDNITSVNIVKFSDISQIFIGETKIFEESAFKEEYKRTEYFFSVYGEPHSNTNMAYQLMYSKSGSYIVGDESDPEDLWIFPEYTFFKEVEKIWTQKYLEKVKNDNKATFQVLKSALHHNTLKDRAIQRFIGVNGITAKSIKTSNISDIIIEDEKIIIDGTEYNMNCMKCMYLEKGNLVIEHENHKRKFLGLVEKGDIHNIELWGLGNALALLLILKEDIGFE